MTDLERLRRHLVHEIFARAVAPDPDLVAAIERFDGDVAFNDGRLSFTLPHLYRFAVMHLEASSQAPIDALRCDYKAFRRMLYQSAVNTELRQFGARVVVEHVDDDHALSRYRLSHDSR